MLAQDSLGYSSKSDTYSIGIAALELATGEAPFAGLPVTEASGVESWLVSVITLCACVKLIGCVCRYTEEFGHDHFKI